MVMFTSRCRYKFYLAFENSYHCTDYITEKLWANALYSGAVPVVFGPHRDDVSAVLPPKSYIHVEDFESAEELVHFLNYLDKNVTAYAEYLRWRTWIQFLNQRGVYDPKNQTIEDTISLLSTEEQLMVRKHLPWKYGGFCALCHR